MKKILTKLYRSSMKDFVDCLRKNGEAHQNSEHEHAANASVPLAKNTNAVEVNEVAALLQTKFQVYTTANLKGVMPEDFKSSLQARLGTVDSQVEGYSDAEIDYQRDLSIKFHWGHHHDFGSFKLEGRMKNRHINMLANFVNMFPVSLGDFEGKSVFDVGCWTGGTTLMLATLADEVFAIEEVKKYADTTTYLTESFGLDDRVTVESRSIYDCNDEKFYDRFDIVFFPGVVYHLTDPLFALRILYNSLKPGGFILVESAGINSEEPYCRFDGSMIWKFGTKEQMNRGGWNWFMPSPLALQRMMNEAGFEAVQTAWHNTTNRVYGFGRKVSQVGICRAGLSVPDIR